LKDPAGDAFGKPHPVLNKDCHPFFETWTGLLHSEQLYGLFEVALG